MVQVFSCTVLIMKNSNELVACGWNSRVTGLFTEMRQQMQRKPRGELGPQGTARAGLGRTCSEQPRRQQRGPGGLSQTEDPGSEQAGRSQATFREREKGGGVARDAASVCSQLSRWGGVL